MSRQLTKKQRKFAEEYLETGNGALAAAKAYDVSTDESARAIASQNLTKPKVREYLESKAERAAEIVFELAETSENPSVRLNASKDILDRAGFKPKEETPPNTGNTTYNFLFNADVQEDVRLLEEKIKARLIQGHAEET